MLIGPWSIFSWGRGIPPKHLSFISIEVFFKNDTHQPRFFFNRYSVFTCIHHSMGMANRCLGDHGQSPMACTRDRNDGMVGKKWLWICRVGEDVLKINVLLELTLWKDAFWGFDPRVFDDLEFDSLFWLHGRWELYTKSVHKKFSPAAYQ